jgi:hypothetical protein
MEGIIEVDSQLVSPRSTCTNDSMPILSLYKGEVFNHSSILRCITIDRRYGIYGNIHPFGVEGRQSHLFYENQEVVCEVTLGQQLTIHGVLSIASPKRVSQ